MTRWGQLLTGSEKDTRGDSELEKVTADFPSTPVGR